MQSILPERTETDAKLITLSERIDEFEGYALPHARRVAAIALSLGSSFNLASRDRFFLEQAALIHDIGELTMNREYVRARRGLSVAERIDLERHPVIGEQEAAKLGLPRGVQLIVRWHHEWWNGGGYPDAIVGDQIPMAARILRVADTFAAMTGSRPFRVALSNEDAKKYLSEWAGIEFDPMVVKTFLTLDLREVETPVVLHRSPSTDPFEDGFSLI
ncbi:MAG: HD domain-containing phosphohydrolase [Pyrinomonadaceae bacterium]